VNPLNEQKETRSPDEKEPFCALIFKVQADPYAGTLSYIRVYSGTLEVGSHILNCTKRKREKVARIVCMHANKREEMERIKVGQIGALIGLRDVTTGDTLAAETAPILLEKMQFPEPVIWMAIEPKTKEDEEKLSTILKNMQMEDPTFFASTDSETGQCIISGMGELHLDVIVERMRREHKLGVSVGRPHVSYRETVKKEAVAEGEYIRQTGGRGQYGHVWLRVCPAPKGSGVQFFDRVKGGAIPKEFVPAVEQGVKEAAQRGVLAGYPVVDVAVTLFDGSFHEVDSTELAFKIAASNAFYEAVKKASPVLLEPVMRLQIYTPQSFMGEVINDLNARGGQIHAVSEKGHLKVIDALVPLAKMFGYATALRSLTQGRATYSMEFAHYKEVEQDILLAANSVQPWL
jgi:elongation factor G